MAVALALSSQSVAPSRQKSLQVEWLYYGGDPGNSEYSPLTDVNGGNIQRLNRVAMEALGGAASRVRNRTGLF